MKKNWQTVLFPQSRQGRVKIYDTRLRSMLRVICDIKQGHTRQLPRGQQAASRRQQTEECAAQSRFRKVTGLLSNHLMVSSKLQEIAQKKIILIIKNTTHL